MICDSYDHSHSFNRKPEFASLPPHFARADSAKVNDMIAENFAGVTDSKTKAILRIGLASVVYHSEWIHETLPATHPIFQTRVFADDKLMKAVKPGIIAGLDSSPILEPQGVPPSVVNLVELRNLRTKITDIEATIQTTVAESVEKAAISSGQITAEVLKKTVSQLLDARGIGVRTETQSSSSSSSSTRSSWKTFMWGGTLGHFAPAKFLLPAQTNFLNGLKLWYSGYPALGIRPYHFLRSSDLAGTLDTKTHRKQQRILSAWKSSMTAVVALAKDADANFDVSRLAVESGATTEVINDLYKIVWPKIEEKHAKNDATRKRKASKRVRQFTVLSIGKLLRPAKKTKTTPTKT